MIEKINQVYEDAHQLYNQSEVDVAFDRMAEKITAELADKNPIFLCVMVGGIIPMGHLLTRLDFLLRVDYIHMTRYQGELTGGEIAFKAEPRYDLKGRTVVIVDDILDRGITLANVVQYCREKGAEDIHTAVLVDKQRERDEGGLAKANYTGLEVPDKYVFGYGLDYKHYLRNAPGIFQVADED